MPRVFIARLADAELGEITVEEPSAMDRMLRILPRVSFTIRVPTVHMTLTAAGRRALKKWRRKWMRYRRSRRKQRRGWA